MIEELIDDKDVARTLIWTGFYTQAVYNNWTPERASAGADKAVLDFDNLYPDADTNHCSSRGSIQPLILCG